MKKEKLWNRVTVAVMIPALLLTSILAYNPNILKIESASTLYASTVFDKESVMSVNILMDDEEWDEMLENAASEEYYSCDVVMNGERYNNVGIRPKGNTSLSSIVSDDTTDRFSFKLEFDHYVTGQTLDGLDKLCLNNLMSDVTYMKEYLSYEILSYMGANSSLYSYASIHRNGEYWGLYLALEAVEDSFLQRTYGSADGELYKPETMDGGNEDGEMQDFRDAMENRSEEELEALKEKFQEGGFGERGGQQNAEVPNRNDMGNDDHGGMGGGNMGSDLSYTDDDLDSYDTIWESSIFDITDADKERVVEALEHITNQEDVEEYLDVDQMLRYIAANVVLLNDDSYFGNMLHNYYLYEDDGVLSMIAWDYNLAFGGFSMGTSDATSLVNRAIDDVVSSGSLEDRPFLAAALSTDEYMEQYHEYLQELLDGYFTSGTFEKTIAKIRTLISPYVERDPTAFYTYDEFETGADTLLSFVNARVESIEAQLDGEIPATNSERTGDDYTLIDGSSIRVSDMGTQGGGQGGKDMGAMEMPDFNNAGTATESFKTDKPTSENDTEQTDKGTAADTNQMQSPPDMGQIEAQAGTPADASQSQESSENSEQDEIINSADSNETEDKKANRNPANMPDNPISGNSASTTGISREAILYTVASIVVMIGAILFSKLYQRRRFRSR